MADGSKHNGGSLTIEIKHGFYLLRAKRIASFAYGFIFVFIAFTVFLAFNPSSNSSSPWFTDNFSNTVTSPHYSSIFSYFSPDSSSQQEYHDDNNDIIGSQNNTRKIQPQSHELKDDKFSNNSRIQSPEPINQPSSSNLTSSLANKKNNESNSGFSAVNSVESLLGCDLFDGEWVKDESYPLYKPGSCSLIDEQFNCFLNGRPDNGYQKFKWKPRGCTIPRLNGTHMLELLRGKRLVYVGDSLNRNMWESLVCTLRSSIKDQKNVYEAYGRYQFRTEASYSFVFKDYNCTVEFFVAPFLVQEWEFSEKNGSKKETLRLDIIGRSADGYKNANIIVFNTGHWWTHDKTSKGKDYYQEGSHVYGELNVLEAFRKALTTWGRWVDANVDPKRSLVFFRGYSESHFSGGQWNSGGQCNNETEPIKEKSYLREYPDKMITLERVLRGMKFPVSYLNITKLTDYRKDAHPSVFRKLNLTEEERKSPLMFQDCSHWCLPGVPDAWNELLYAQLLIRNHLQKPHS
ncbi:protein trichome birefringence-like [Impatiens glandulifera]|uniref:protein trichome birefringence-like n=1 Tax=Impatiens glandulifera TaxID=253017 RepID=UPI001FB09CF2|nr:protein trichome birefringence-like [Impatiens glandulifera]